MPWDNWEAAAHYTHTFIHLCSFSYTLTKINDWVTQKLWAVSSSSNRGFCVCPCWQLPAGEQYTRERVLATGCLSCLADSNADIGATYTHGERLGSLLDDKALNDMREDLGLDDSLGRFVLSVLRRGARHGGRCLALVSWGHGWRWCHRCSDRPLGWDPACWPRN